MPSFRLGGDTSVLAVDQDSPGSNPSLDKFSFVLKFCLIIMRVIRVIIRSIRVIIRASLVIRQQI